MGRRRSFDGNVVVVTGAAGGMGRALCRRFGGAGAIVVHLDVDRDGLADLGRDLDAAGVRNLPVTCDVTDRGACEGAVARVVEAFGGIDVVVNNAGVTHFSPAVETGVETMRRVMDVNFFGSVHCTLAAMDSIVERHGMIVVVSSIAGLVPLFHRCGYCASKHALHGYFGSLRAELAGDGVDVLIVCPGFTATGIADNALGGDGGPATESQSTVGRIASADEVADAVFRAAERGDRLLVLSAVGRITHFLWRFWPSLYQRIMLGSLK